MRSRLVPVLAFAVLLAPALAPEVEAGDPQKTAWSPYAAPSGVTDLALARHGTTVAAALKQPEAKTPGGVPGLPGTNVGTDLLVFHVRSGLVYNTTPPPEGRSRVAVSASGNALVSTVDRVMGTGGVVLKAATATFLRPSNGQDNWSGTTTSFGEEVAGWTENLPGSAASVALSRDGRRVFVAANVSDTEGRILGYNALAAERPQVLFDRRTQGGVNDLAASLDGRWIVAGGRHVEGGKVYGIVHLLEAPLGTTRTFLLQEENASEIRAVAITPDGSYFAAVTVDGRLLFFFNQGSELRGPASTHTLPQRGGRDVVLSDDARIVAAAAGKSLTVFSRTPGGLLAERWNATTSGGIASLDADATGDLLLAATSDGSLAFGSSAPVPYWKYAGAASRAAVASDASFAAFAIGSQVHVAVLPARVGLLYGSHPATADPNPPERGSRPGEPVVFQAFLRNDGAQPLRASVTAPSLPGIQVEANRSAISLLPGDAAPIELRVTPGRLAAGSYSFNLSVKGTSVPLVQNFTIPFKVLPTTAVSVKINGAKERRLAQGGNDSILLGVFNDGNGPASVTVTVEQTVSHGGQWPIRVVGDPTFSLAPKTQGTVRILVETPQRAANGTTNEVAVLVRSGAFSQAENVVYRVNPHAALNLTLPARSRLVYPGEFAQFNLTVKNTGSIHTEFEATYDLKTVGERNWVVDLDIAPFPLAVDETRTFPVRIFAPKDGLGGERAIVRVEVKNVQLTRSDPVFRENVTVVANLIERATTSTPAQPGARLPAPDLALAIAAIAAAASMGALRGRKP